MHKTSATLLIIDDDDVVRASLAAYLEDSGLKSAPPVEEFLV